MRLHFLGGADEVGASCLLVETADCRVLVDAGIHMGAGRSERLPDLAPATDLGGLDAVVLSHAHLDHSGALPLVHGAFPRTPVLCSQPTASLLRVLLLDAVKIMQQQSAREDEIPLYPLPAVEALLADLQPVRLLEPVPICGGRAAVTLFPAGHVLGAAAVGLHTAEGDLLVTGDVSITPQLTVSGMPVPRFEPDLVVCESTYGARLHASRKAEEQRLAATVLDALAAGRRVLIPAFALGRAQEVLLILRRALASPEAPAAAGVWVDGMVRAVCAIYDRHPDYLAPGLRRRAEAGKSLFYTADGRVRPVRDPAEREAVLNGPPGVIVASSGMLAGGPSAWYAGRLAADPDALIAITGYQDEEAPGRRLQEVARAGSGSLLINGQKIDLACRVETYGLSAHADAQQLAGLLDRLAPAQVALVHGDPSAREGLARVLSDGGLDVALPAAGDRLEASRRGRRRARPVAGIGRGRPLDRDALAALHAELWRPSGRRVSRSVRQLAELWYGSRAVPADLDPVHALLRESPDWFEPDPGRPFCYRPVDAEAGPAEPAAPVRDQAGRLEQNAALAAVDRLFGEDSGLHRRGAEREGWTLRLYFHFPLVAAKRLADRIDALADETGWSVALHPEPHLGALEQALRGLLPAGVELLRPPSVYRDQGLVKAQLSRRPDEPAAEALRRSYREQTGFDLSLVADRAGTPVAKQAFDASGRMEINLAFRAVDEAFAGRETRPAKKSKKNAAAGPFIELCFISPEVGARCSDTIAALENRTGWRIAVADRVDQQAVLRAAAELIPAGWDLARNPGLDLGGRRVLLKLRRPVADDERERVSARLEQRTGFALGVR